MKIADVCNILDAKVVSGSDKLDLEVTCAAASDLMSDLLRNPKEGALVLTGLNTTQVIRTAVIAGLAAVVFVRGKEPDAEMVLQAEENGLPLLSTPFNMYSSCGRLYKNGLQSVR